VALLTSHKCNFCGREAERTLAGPSSYICDACLATIADGQELAGVVEIQSDSRCNFCLRPPAEVKFLMGATEGAAICDSCIEKGVLILGLGDGKAK